MKFLSCFYPALAAFLSLPAICCSADSAVLEKKKEVALRLAMAAFQSGTYHQDDLFEDIQLMFDGEIDENELYMMIEESIDYLEPYGGDSPVCESNSLENRYADRHVKRVLATANDYDCMEREFDATDPSFQVRDAATVFAKCRLVIIRNLFDGNVIDSVKNEFARFLTAMDEGIVPASAPTTNGDPAFFVDRGAKRFDINVPRYVAPDEILFDETILGVINDSRILGSSARILATGGLLAESGCKEGGWHTDDVFPFGDFSFGEFGIAGQDIPSFALTLGTPLINVTHDHGPTEFCMGTSHFHGLAQQGPLEVFDQSLLEQEDHLFQELYDFYNNEVDVVPCPARMIRTPTLNVGDAILFDYAIMHRGTENTSPDMRPIYVVTYSQKWYKDHNFDYEHVFGTDPDWKEEMVQNCRFADIQKPYDPRDEIRPLESVINFMSRGEGTPEETGLELEIWVSNLDVPDAAIYYEDELLSLLPPGKSAAVQVLTGSSFSVRSLEDGRELRSWKVHSARTQVVISNEMIKDTK